MGFARSASIPYLVISWLTIATVNVAAQQELSGTVVDVAKSPSRFQVSTRRARLSQRTTL
jgi:hypothetical protein